MIFGAYGYWRVRRWQFLNLAFVGAAHDFYRTKMLNVSWVAVISAKSHKRQRRKRQSVTAKREKSQTPQVLTAILTLPNLT